MSGIFVVVPVLTLAPVVLSATAAVAASLGFSMVHRTVEDLQNLFHTEEGGDFVEFDVAEARGLTRLIQEQGPLVLERQDATIAFVPGKGRVQMLVRGRGGGSREDLEALGRQVLDGMAQQYAYHLVVSDLKARGFDKVEETRDEDGTLHLRLRRWD